MQRLFPTSRAHGTPSAIYDDVQFPGPPAHRPYVALNMVSTVDGKTTLDEGQTRGPIGSPVDRELMGRLRLHVDAVVRGASTVRRSPYYPGVPEELEHRRIDRGLQRQPLAIVVSASGNLPLDAPFFAQAPRRPVAIVPKSIDTNTLAALRDVADTLLVGSADGLGGEGGVNLVEALKMLRTQYNVTHLLSEGGPRLNYEFLQAGLLDELFWTVAPKFAGNAADLTLVHGPASLTPLPELELQTAYAGASELFLRYKIKTDLSRR